MRNLVLVLGDQLDPDSAALADFDRRRDRVLMAEVREEATYVAQHKQRLVLFFAAMRHCRDELIGRGLAVDYVALEEARNTGSLAGELRRWVLHHRPRRVVLLEPGDYRVGAALRDCARETGVALETRADTHFLCSSEAFARFSARRGALRMETFYRHMRRRSGVLMAGERPVGERWNFDRDNRARLSETDAAAVPALRGCPPDALTREVMAMVQREFPGHPGRLDGFDYPVDRAQARGALHDFIVNRLAEFGTYQDAMHAEHTYLYHSRLSASLNLHLLDPREVMEAALGALERRRAPLNAVEGFVRQVLGWREFVRGIYWREMPAYADGNTLDAQLPLPAFLWDADTDMHCVRRSVQALIEHAYAHHIQRLMVLGQIALLLGVDPIRVHHWHMAMYADAVDWVSLPNVLGMSQYADGGLIASKPYCASGSYIDRMSNYCRDCRFEPRQATGERACPFTTLYWDFLRRHRDRFSGNRRMGLQLKNLQRKSAADLQAIARGADRLRELWT